MPLPERWLILRTAVSEGGDRMRIKSRRGPFSKDTETGDAGDWLQDGGRPQIRYPDEVDGESESWAQTLETAAESVVGGRAPFRDLRRDDREFVGDDRRNRKKESLGTENLLTAVARKALESDGRRRTIADLDELVVETAGLEGGELRARIMSENERKRRSGHRPVFVVDSEGKVGLTDWDLPGRYAAHEERLKGAELELREIVKRALLERVASQTHRVFRRLMFMLLERLNFTDVREFRTIGEKRLALVARQRTGVDEDETATCYPPNAACIAILLPKSTKESSIHVRYSNSVILCTQTMVSQQGGQGSPIEQANTLAVRQTCELYSPLCKSADSNHQTARCIEILKIVAECFYCTRIHWGP